MIQPNKKSHFQKKIKMLKPINYEEWSMKNSDLKINDKCKNFEIE